MSRDEYRLINIVERNKIFINNRGYIFKLDLNYPRHLHELDNNYPMAPVLKTIEAEITDEMQHKLHALVLWRRVRVYPEARVLISAKEALLCSASCFLLISTAK